MYECDRLREERDYWKQIAQMGLDEFREDEWNRAKAAEAAAAAATARSLASAFKKYEADFYILVDDYIIDGLIVWDAVAAARTEITDVVKHEKKLKSISERTQRKYLPYPTSETTAVPSAIAI